MSKLTFLLTTWVAHHNLHASAQLGSDDAYGFIRNLDELSNERHPSLTMPEFVQPSLQGQIPVHASICTIRCSHQIHVPTLLGTKAQHNAI